MVGAILLDESSENAEGRRRILEKIQQRRGVTPLAVNAPAKYTLLYKNSREFFGRSPSMRCPYYIEDGGGLCSVWKYREAVCSTYFCKHVSGADGKKFWMSLKSYLALVEVNLARSSVFKLFPDYLVSGRHLTDLYSDVIHQSELDDTPPPAAVYEKTWGAWAGLEIEFFKESYRLALKLTPHEFEHVMGLDGDISLAALETSMAEALAPKIPLKLKLNPDLKIQWTDRGSVVIGGYSELDALELPGESYALLREFKGTDDVKIVRKHLQAAHAADFSDELIRTFYHHRILVDPNETR